jgi:hypothetical protein
MQGDHPCKHNFIPCIREATVVEAVVHDGDDYIMFRLSRHIIIPKV